MDKVYIDKVEKEWEAIKKTEFWKLFVERILSFRKRDSRHCETDEIVEKYQGKVEAIDEVLGVPDRILKTIRG